MYEYIIKEYIRKLTIKDIQDLALNENLVLNDNDTHVVYNYIKNNYTKALKNTNLIDITELKDKLDIETYEKINIIYNKYKEKFLK